MHYTTHAGERMDERCVSKATVEAIVAAFDARIAGLTKEAA